MQIAKNGKQAAALIGPEDFELLEQLEMLHGLSEYWPPRVQMTAVAQAWASYALSLARDPIHRRI